MVFFRVTNSINIKTTDGTLVKYDKFRFATSYETAYLTTLDDFDDLQEIFSNVDEEKYIAKPLLEEKFRNVEDFPIELGISNAFEYDNYKKFKEQVGSNIVTKKDDVENMFFTPSKADLFKQIKKTDKDEVSLAIIGKPGISISQMTASCGALKILHNKLSQVYKKVKMDLYIDASNNSYFSRDKQIFETQNYIHKILPLSLSVKKLCNYDYFIDNSSALQRNSYFKNLNIVDAWLYKFGIDYKKIPDILKHNEPNLDLNLISQKLKDKMSKIKKRNKVVLFHPYSANIKKSIPQEYAINYLNELLEKVDDDTIVISTLIINPKLKDDRYIEFSKESKTYIDFAYIVSNSDKIITVDTCTYHIADSFLIPTVVISSDEKIDLNSKYYNYVKIVKIDSKEKNISNLVFENDNLTFYKFESWKKLKMKQIIQILDSF